jgi:excisionase family DNA binding protein
MTPSDPRLRDVLVALVEHPDVVPAISPDQALALVIQLSALQTRLAAMAVRQLRPDGDASGHADRTTQAGDTDYETLPDLLTPDEFREYVGIGRSTVYDLVRRDELPHVKVGRGIRIPKTAVRARGVE